MLVFSSKEYAVFWYFGLWLPMGKLIINVQKTAFKKSQTKAMKHFFHSLNCFRAIYFLPRMKREAS